MNPIKNLRGKIKEKVSLMQPKNFIELKKKYLRYGVILDHRYVKSMHQVLDVVL